MGIYIIILVVLLIVGDVLKPNKKLKNKKTYMIFVFFILGTTAAIRSPKVGIDTMQFYRAFEIIGNMSLNVAINATRYEVGFVMLCKGLNVITSNPQILIIITSLFINGVVCLFIYRESKDIVLSSILYITLNYYFAYMNIMRQAIAICIIIIGYTFFLKKGKKVKFIITALLAFTFHTTGIIPVLLVLFDKLEYKNKYYAITIIGSMIAFLLAPVLFSIVSKLLNSYSGYKDSSFYDSNYFAAVFIYLINLTFLTVSFLCNKNKNIELSKMLFISSMAVITSAIGIRITLIGRMANYFNIYNIVLLPNAVKNNCDKTTRQLIYLLTIGFSVAYFLIIMIYRPEWYGAIPYKTFIN